MCIDEAITNSNLTVRRNVTINSTVVEKEFETEVVADIEAVVNFRSALNLSQFILYVESKKLIKDYKSNLTLLFINLKLISSPIILFSFWQLWHAMIPIPSTPLDRLDVLPHVKTQMRLWMTAFFQMFMTPVSVLLDSSFSRTSAFFQLIVAVFETTPPILYVFGNFTFDCRVW